MGNRIVRDTLILLCGAVTLASLSGCGSAGAMSPGTTSSTQTWSISGALTPATDTAGASVTLSGSANATTTADSNGNYSFSGLSNGTYIVTPNQNAVTFTPDSQTISISGSSKPSVNFNAVKLQSITITAASSTVAKGSTDQFTAIGTFSNGTTQNLTASVNWNSSNTVAVAINNSGLATGMNGGSSNISASHKGVTSNTVALSVSPAALQSITISAANSSIAKGSTDQLVATGRFSDGTTQNLTNSVTWSSSNATVATINASGLATGVSAGSSNISASQNGVISNAIVLLVNAATLQSITITATNGSIAKGTTDQFTATGTFSDGTTQNLTNSAIWTSSNTAVVTISNGIATGASAGSSNISAAQNGITSNSFVLSVTAATLQSITITSASASIAKGTTDQFTATGSFSDGTTQNLTNSATWSSSNTAVATISSSGLATAAGIGSSSISATQNGLTSNVIALNVTAPTLLSIAITAPGTPLAAGSNEQLTATGTYTDGTTQNLTNSASWSSSNSAAATVTSSGIATGVAVGQTTISAVQAGITGSLVLPVTATISGAISPASNGSGATLTLSGPTNAAITADANGNFAFTGLANGSYTLTPTKSGIVFSPTSQVVTISGTSSTAINFTATVQTFSLSGSLTPSATTAGATVALSGATTATTVADVNGNYSFNGLVNGSYTVTPSKTNYVFSPANQTVSMSGANKTAVNFSLQAGQLSATPSSFSFGTVNLGITSPLQTGTLTATTGDVTITTETLSGTGFMVSGITLPLTILSGQSASFGVAFAPTLTGNASGTLSFSSNASSNPSPITLSGAGAGLSITPASLSFGAVADGTSSASQTGTLSAVGASVTVSAASTTGAAFSVSGLPSLPFTIAAGQTQQFNVTFSPASGSPGAAAGNIAFTSGINNPTQTWSGTGTSNVVLSWTASGTPSVTYNVYRCSTSASACVQSSPMSFTRISSSVSALTYADLSVSSGQTYYYSVTSVDTSNTESALSTVTSAVIP